MNTPEDVRLGPERRKRRRSRRLDAAIVGMAWRSDRHDDLVALWKHLRTQAEVSVGEPFDSWEPGNSRIIDALRSALGDAGFEDGIADDRRVLLVIAHGDSHALGGLGLPDQELIISRSISLLRSLHPDWTDVDLEAVRTELTDGLPRQVSHSIAGLASNHLRFSKVSYVDIVDSLPLAAVELGARALVERRVDLAIVGSVKYGEASSSGTEVGCVVLVRRRDAERTGRRIYAVIQGLGFVRGGVGAICQGHSRAIRRALRQAAIANSTADRIEPVCAETPDDGIGRLIASALALHHRVLPAKHSAATNEWTSRPWIHGDSANPRRARFGNAGEDGTYCHAILEEHSPSADGATVGCMCEWETEAILLGAPDRARWLEVANALLRWLETGPNSRVALRDLAFTLNTNQAEFPFRVGFVVESAGDLIGRLRATIGRLRDPSTRSLRDALGTYFWEEPLGKAGRLAFLFPGEGAQYHGMLGDLCFHFPEVRLGLDGADRVALERGHRRLPSTVLFGGDDMSGLWDVETAVNVVLSGEWGLHRLLLRLGLAPDVVLGHSSGELLALAAAGVFDADGVLEQELGALGSVFAALESLDRLPVGALVAVAADRDRVLEVCRELGSGVMIAMDNCPHQVVIAGKPDETARVVSRLRARGFLCEPLPFRRAYHTARFADALEPIRSFFARLDIRTPAIPVYSCATAAPMGFDAEVVRRLAVEQWVTPVRFRSTIERMYEDGVRLFVEVGARGNLSGFVEDSLRGRPHFAIAANLPRRAGVTQLNHLVAALYAQGISLAPEHLFARRRARAIDFGGDLPLTIPPTKPPETRLSTALIERLRDRARTDPHEELEHHLVSRFPALERAGHRREGSDSLETRGHPSSNGKPGSNGYVEKHVPPDRAPHLDFESPLDEVRSRIASTPSSNAMLAYFETMDAFLESQRAVTAAFLAGRPPERHPSRNGHVPQWNYDSTTAAETRTDAAPEAEPGATHIAIVRPSVCERSTLQTLLLSQVSQRTGYPVEMLELDFDMEGDLGIDSIKRVEILGELQSQGLVPSGTELETLSRCRTLGEVLAGLAREARPASAPELSAWPGEVVFHEPGRELVARGILDADTDPIAAHHTLGGRTVSEIEPDRLGFPVLPFTVMAEMLAQAAALLAPGRVVVELRDVRANRWIPYGESPSTLEIHALRDPDRPDEVLVSMVNLGLRGESKGDNGEPAVRGIVVFGDARRPAPACSPFDLGTDRHCRFDAAELYRDQWLFHGPALQSLVRVGSSSPSGIEGTLRVLPRRALLPERLWPTLHTDPIVLDAFTHLLGCWGIDKQAGEQGDVIFPLRLGRLTLFADDPPEGEEVECRISVREIGRHRVTVDAEIASQEGRIWMRVENWQDWRFYWPGRYRDVFRRPDSVFVGEVVDLSDAEPRYPDIVLVWLEPPADMGKPVWRDVLEWISLEPEERRRNHARCEDERAFTHRLWGLVAAKEAARRLWKARDGRSFFPADLILEGDEPESLCVRSLNTLDRATVSIAHNEGVVVAIAALDSTTNLGIDVVHLDPNKADRDADSTRVESVRRAVRKATGFATVDVRLVDAATGEFAASLPEGHAIRCRATQRGEYILAWAVNKRRFK